MSGWSMLRMQVLVEQRIFWRNRSAMFFTFILPIVLVFVLAMSDDPAAGVPFIIALGILSVGFQGLAIQLSMHRDQGVLKRIMATPLPPALLVAGKSISTMIVIVLELLIMLTLGIILFDAPIPHAPATLLLFVLLGTATFVALGFALASLVPTSESAPAITNAAYLGLILVTTLLEQVEAIPDEVQSAGLVLPLVHLFVPIHDAWLGGWDADNWWSVAVLGAWCAAGVIWTARRFRWEPAGER